MRRFHFLPASFPRFAAGMALTAIALAGCAGREVSRFHQFTELPQRSRPEPARVMTGLPRDLSGEGYILVGHIEVRQPVRTCEGTRCRAYAHERSGRESARELAAERGGDVILLQRDGDLLREVSSREGRCKVPHAPSLLRNSDPLGDDCDVYESIPYIQEWLVTEGYVWRYEPALVSERSRALWRRWFGERRGPDADSVTPPETEAQAPAER